MYNYNKQYISNTNKFSEFDNWSYIIYVYSVPP